MIKNQTIVIIILLSFILNPSTIGLVTASENPSVIVSNYSIHPEVLMPGDYGTLTITLTNAAHEMHLLKEEKEKRIHSPILITERVERKFAPIPAEIRKISVHSNEIEIITNEYRNIDIGPGQSIILPFEIQAPLKTGIHLVEIRIEVGCGTDIRHPISIVVDKRAVKLSANIPPIAYLNSTQFEVEIGNQRPNTIEGVNIIAMIDEKYGQIRPKTRFIGTMSANEIQTIDFELFYHNLNVPFNEISFKLEFWNGINSHTEIVSFPVELIDRSSASLSIINYPPIIRQGDIAKIEVEVMNEKPNKITGVKIVPVNANDFQITPSVILVGTLKPGEIMTTRPEMNIPHAMADVLEEDIRLKRMIFRIDTHNLAIGKHPIDFVVIYRDEDARIFESKPVSVRLTVIEPIPIVPIGIGVAFLILLIGLGYYLSRKKNDKHKDYNENMDDF